MSWANFNIIFYALTVCWALAIGLSFIPRKTKNAVHALSLIGMGLLAIFIISLWIKLERPPLKTRGETRLWYALFLSLIGFTIYYKWKYRWLLIYSLAMSVLFLYLNFSHPDVFTQTLMPALQSIWFVPHVIVYILAYAFLAAAALAGIKGLLLHYQQKSIQKIIALSDNLVYLGFSFLTLGLVFGALWAKEAWGSYWTWDPKETWAFITWFAYLIYIHFRHSYPKNTWTPLWFLALSFLILLMCWFGINYLPSVSSSVHTYAS